MLLQLGENILLHIVRCYLCRPTMLIHNFPTFAKNLRWDMFVDLGQTTYDILCVANFPDVAVSKAQCISERGLISRPGHLRRPVCRHWSSGGSAMGKCLCELMLMPALVSLGERHFLLMESKDGGGLIVR